MGNRTKIRLTYSLQKSACEWKLSKLFSLPSELLNKLERPDVKVKNLSHVIRKILDPAGVKILLGMNFIEKTNPAINGKYGTFNTENRQP
jgi:hypothetical protein